MDFNKREVVFGNHVSVESATRAKKKCNTRAQKNATNNRAICTLETLNDGPRRYVSLAAVRPAAGQPSDPVLVHT